MGSLTFLLLADCPGQGGLFCKQGMLFKAWFTAVAAAALLAGQRSAGEVDLCRRCVMGRHEPVVTCCSLGLRYWDTLWGFGGIPGYKAVQE